MGKKSLSVGLKQAQVLCKMEYKQRLEFIAEGLPIILSSAEGYWDAARRLNDTREGDGAAKPCRRGSCEGHSFSWTPYGVPRETCCLKDGNNRSVIL